MRHGFVISQPENVEPKLLDCLRDLGCAEPNISEVNMRNMSAEELLSAGTISPAAYLSITHGRSTHYELPSTAGVGCYLSHLSVCRKIAALPQDDLGIIVEGDCILDVKTVELILKSIESGITLSIHDPHVIFVGSSSIQGCNPYVHKLCNKHITDSHRVIPNSNIKLRATLPGAMTLLTHCNVYTPSGARFVLKHLDNKPASLQWDSALSAISALSTGAEPVLLWWTTNGAYQRTHISSIQDVCLTCRMQGATPVIFLVGVVIFALLLGVIIARLRCK